MTEDTAEHRAVIESMAEAICDANDFDPYSWVYLVTTWGADCSRCDMYRKMASAALMESVTANGVNGSAHTKAPVALLVRASNVMATLRRRIPHLSDATSAEVARTVKELRSVAFGESRS